MWSTRDESQQELRAAEPAVLALNARKSKGMSATLSDRDVASDSLF